MAGAARLLLLAPVARPLPLPLPLPATLPLPLPGKLGDPLPLPKWENKDLRLSFLLVLDWREEDDVEGPTGAALVTLLGSGEAG